jgi:hypothetical protein
VYGVGGVTVYVLRGLTRLMSGFDKSPVVSECDESVVRALLYAAQLEVSDRELEWFVAEYRTLRALADAMYIPELDSITPAVFFDPAEPPTEE